MISVEQGLKYLKQCANCTVHYPSPDYPMGPMYRGAIEVINNPGLFDLTEREVKILDSSGSREEAGLYGTLEQSLGTTEPRLAATIWREGLTEYWMWDYVKGGCRVVCQGCPNRINLERLINGDENGQ